MFEVSALTDIGKTRPVNQDALFCSLEPVGTMPNLFIVADGLGGHKGGDIASKLAVTSFCDYIIKEHAAPVGESSKDNLLDILASAANAANSVVFNCAEKNPELFGMGTTFTACTISDGKCLVIHIGDSRAYIITPGKIKQLTNDHSYVNEMVKAGEITRQEARKHPRRNVLTKVLGIDSEMSADGCIAEAEPDSVILLCSDGLYNMVPEKKIVDLINNTKADPAEALVEAANSAGGKDNITVIVVKL